MSLELITIIVLGAFFLLLFLGLPVAFSLITCALFFTIFFWSPSALYVAATTIFVQSTRDIYLAGPLFIVMAALLEHSGIGEDLFDIIYNFLPELPGGLAVGTVCMCTVLAAMTGIGATGVVTVGVIALPEMLKRGYGKKMALGCIPAGAALGPLIPPSVLMIIVAGVMGLSVGRLFAAGLIPGLMMAACFVIYIICICFFRPHLAPSIPLGERLPWKARIVSLVGAILPILLVIAVLGSIYTGVATPTEAAGVGAVGAAICASIHRRLSWLSLRKAMESTLRVTCMVLWLLVGGSMFAAMISAVGVSELIAISMMETQNPTLSLGIMMLISLIMGMFMDGIAISVICLPIFTPIVQSIGIDPYLFAILFTISLIVGYLTPPFGMNLFYTKVIAPPEITMMDLYKSALPYVLIQIIVLIIVFLMPGVSLWLPSIIF